MVLPIDVTRLLVEVASELDHAMSPLIRAARHPASLQRLLHQAGWDVDGLLAADQSAAIVLAVESFETAVSEVMSGPLDVVEVLEVGAAIGATTAAFLDAATVLEPVIEAAFESTLSGSDTSNAAELAAQLVADVGDLLFVRWLQQTSPTLYQIAQLTGIVTIVRRPALFLDPPPAVADPLPVRWAMQRIGLNVDGLGNPALVGLLSILTELPPDAYRSPAAFVAAVRQLLRARLDAFLTEIANRPIGLITVEIGGSGVSFSAPNWLPTAHVPLETGIKFELPTVDTPGGAPPVPWEIVLERETWSLNWNPGDDAFELPLVGDMLVLVDRFATTGAEPPSISLTVDATDAAAIALIFRLRLGFRLQIADGLSDEIAITAAAGWDDGLDIAFRAEVLDTLEIPILVPGLTGLALGLVRPAIELTATDLDENPRLDLEVSIDAFDVHLPAPFFRKANQDDGVWQIESGVAPKVTFTLDTSVADAEQPPLLSLGVAPMGGADGSEILTVDHFALLPIDDDWSLQFEADPIFIGLSDDVGSGIIIEIKPTTYAASPGSIGSISIAEARVILPPDLPAPLEEIVITDATIDETGFTGEVAFAFATPPAGEEPEKLFDALPISFQSISLAIEQNLPTEFEVKAAVLMPYFDEWVDVTIGFDDDLNLSFLVEAVDPEGITMTKEELLLLNFKSAFFEWNSEERSVALELSGGIEPLLWKADGLEWPRLDVTALRVEQDVGSIIDGDPEPPVIRFQEAWLDLKELATLDLFGFHFELNRIGMGYIEDTDELWIDLTGSLRLIELLPVGLGVEGFRITWPRRIYEELDFQALDELTVDQVLALASKIQVKFDGVYLFFGVPQAVEFEGYIRFIKTAQKVGFAGDVALRVPTTGLAIEAGLMVGMNFAEPAPYPFLYVYFGIMLPSGIPLGQSGLALKGAKGLFGLNVEPDREPDQNPYYDWYKRGPIEGAHPTNKWRDQIWSIAFGAGITITTTDGKILGVQGLLALVIPGPIIFVEGKALIFDGVFPGDSPLKALGYFDGNELTTQLNIEASMELIEGVIDVMAGVEAFFDFRNLLNWHLFVGVDEPLDRRVHANILKLPAIGWLFRADAYLMIDMPAAESVAGQPITSIDVEDLTVRARTGVYIGFEPPKIDLVVASAEVHAVIEGEGLLTINPFLFTGEVGLDALIDVDAFSLVTVSAEASAVMSIDGALPLVVDANIAASVELPVPDVDAVPFVGDHLSSALDWFEETVAELPEIPDHLEVEIPFHWELDAPPVLDPLVVGVSVEGRFAQGGLDAVRVSESLPNDAVIDAIASAPVVALDARPVISFDQSVNVSDHMEFGGFSSGGVERFFAGKLAFEPTLRAVRIFELPNHLFVDGISEDWVEVASTQMSSAADDLWGMFRPAGEFTAAARASRRVLEVWAANPFEFLTGSIPLSMPGDSATSGGTITPRDGLGIDDIAWCDGREVGERCVGGDHFKQALLAGRPAPQFVEKFDSWEMELSIGGLRFQAPDVRLALGGEGGVVELDAPDRLKPFATVDFPQRAERATIRFLGKDASVSARRRVLTGRTVSGTLLTPIDDTVAISTAISTDGEISTFVVEDESGFERLDLASRHVLRVIDVCWQSVNDVADAAVRRRECEANVRVGARAVDPGVVLSPGARYRVEVETSVVLDESESEGAALALASLPGFSGAIQPYRVGQGGPFVATDRFYFRTEGPPSDLRPYVKWLSPSDSAQDRFTRDDIAVRFNRPYVHRLFPDADNMGSDADESPYALEAYVEDAEGRVRRDWFMNWTTAASATLAPEERHWFDDIAPQSAPGVTPPPDDVLEIRRRLDVRNFAGLATWTTVSAGSLPPTVGNTGIVVGGPVRRGRRVQWKQVDNDQITATLHGSKDISAHVATDGTWGDVNVEVNASEHDVAGAVGVCVLYVDDEHHYQVRVVAGVAQIVRVDGGRQRVLAQRKLEATVTGPRFGPLMPPTLRFAVRTERQGVGIRVSCTIGRTRLEAFDALPMAHSGHVGVLAAGTDATFRSLRVGSVEGPLAPSTRYQVTLAGGAGGRLRHQDVFHDVPADWWAATNGWTLGDGGVRAAGRGSAMRYSEPLDDGELFVRMNLATGQAASIGLRVPDARRRASATARLDLEVSRSGSSVAMSLVARDAVRTAGSVVASGASQIGSTSDIDVRVRLLGDRVRAWVFDRELIDVGLDPDPVDGRVLRQGSFEVTVLAGTPTVREVCVRDVALLRFGFTTGVAASFADVVDDVATVEVGSSTITGTQAAHRAAIAAAVTSQRAWADAEMELFAIDRRFAMRRADRQGMEAARQVALDARVTHDADMAALLGHLGAGPLVVPTDPSVHSLSLASGLIVGWVIRSPRPLDPIMIASSTSAPFDSIGRVSWSLVAVDGDPVPTHHVTSSDGTSVFVFRIAAGAAPSAASSATDLRAVFVDDEPVSLTATRRRDHGDDTSDIDHLLDRPYELGGGSKADVTGTIPLV